MPKEVALRVPPREPTFECNIQKRPRLMTSTVELSAGEKRKEPL